MPTLIRSLALPLLLLSVAVPADAQITQTDEFLPGPIAIGGSLGILPDLTANGNVRLYVHPVVLDVSIGRSITNVRDPFTLAAIDASIPWARRRGFLENTASVSTVGLGLIVVDTDDARSALGPSFVTGTGLLFGRSVEVFANQRIGLILLADEDDRNVGTGDVLFALQAGVRFYP